MIRHTSGYICVSMTGDDLDRLHLPPMTVVNEDRKGTAYAVTVDARDAGNVVEAQPEVDAGGAEGAVAAVGLVRSVGGVVVQV